MTLYNTSPRNIALQLLAVNPVTGATIMDLSPYLASIETTHSDQAESHKASIILIQQNGEFDIFSNGPYSTILAPGAFLKYTITINGTAYPRYYGSIVNIEFGYERDKPQTISIDCLDPAFKLLTATVTSGAFSNQQCNLIASDLLVQYGQYTNTNFYALDLYIPTFQCPSLSILDALSDLFGIPNYFFWFDYAGVFTTSPRVGTGIVGMPDATSAPTPNITLPDNAFISSGKPSAKIYDTINQIKVIGEALLAAVNYGPIQLITSVGNTNNYNFLSPGGSKNYTGISLTTGGSQANQQTVTGLYVKVYDPSFVNGYHLVGGTTPPITPPGADYKYMTSDPTAISADSGLPIPLGPFETNGHDGAEIIRPHIISWKSDGRQEGDIYLQVAVAAGLTTWQVVPMFTDANSDGGGYLYYIEVWGKPIITQDNSITCFLDYDPTVLTQALCLDVFGDHKTYQVLDPTNPATTLTSNPSVGATSFTVASTTGLVPNMQLILNVSGSTYETVQISSIVGSTINLVAATLYAHTSGEAVQGNVTIQPLGMSTPVEVYVNPPVLPVTTVSSTTLSGATTVELTSITNFTVPAISPISIDTMNAIRLGNINTVNTTLSANITAGATSFTVTSATGLYAGGQCTIGNSETIFIGTLVGTTITLPGSSTIANNHTSGEVFTLQPVYEYATIESISGNTLTLTNPLVNEYTTGAPVTAMTGVITADGLFVSNLMRVDFEQGRIVFDDLTYNDFLEDSHNLGVSGTDSTNSAVGQITFAGNAIDLSTTDNVLGNPTILTPSILGVDNPAPTSVYRYIRQSNNVKDNVGFTYTLSGLEVGRGYTVRLHFYEYYYVSQNQRVFNIIINGVTVETDFDIYETAGQSFQLVIKEYEGINPNISTGDIIIQLVNGSNYSSNSVNSPIISCVELVDPQGIGGAFPEINCGGPALTPTPPTVKINGCYSENQRQFGLKSQELDNPLLSTLELCQQSGTYALNRAAWSNYPNTVVTAAFPTVTPAMIIQYFHPYAGVNGADQSMYIQAITHRAERTASDCIAEDTYQGYLLYSTHR